MLTAVQLPLIVGIFTVVVFGQPFPPPPPGTSHFPPPPPGTSQGQPLPSDPPVTAQLTPTPHGPAGIHPPHPPHGPHDPITRRIEMWHSLSHHIMRMLFNASRIPLPKFVNKTHPFRPRSRAKPRRPGTHEENGNHRRPIGGDVSGAQRERQAPNPDSRRRPQRPPVKVNGRPARPERYPSQPGRPDRFPTTGPPSAGPGPADTHYHARPERYPSRPGRPDMFPTTGPPSAGPGPADARYHARPERYPSRPGRPGKFTTTGSPSAGPGPADTHYHIRSFDDFTRLARQFHDQGQSWIPPRADPNRRRDNGRRWPSTPPPATTQGQSWIPPSAVPHQRMDNGHKKPSTPPPAITRAELTNRFAVIIDALSEILGEAASTDPERMALEKVIKAHGRPFEGAAAGLNEIIAGSGIVFDALPTTTTIPKTRRRKRPNRKNNRKTKSSFPRVNELQELLKLQKLQPVPIV